MHIKQINTSMHVKDSDVCVRKMYRKISITYSAENTLVRYLRCLSRFKRMLEASYAFPCTGTPLELETIFSSSCPKFKFVSLSFRGSFSTLLLLSFSLLLDVARIWRNVSTICSI